MLRQAIAREHRSALYAKQFIEAGQLVGDDTMVELVGQRLDQADCASRLPARRFSSHRGASAKSSTNICASTDQPLDGVIEMKVDEDELVRRMIARGRADDKPEVIRERMAAYQRQTMPLTRLLPQRGLLESIDAMGTVDEVSARISAALDHLAERNRVAAVAAAGVGSIYR